MTRPHAKRLQNLDVDQLRRLAHRQSSAINRLERLVGDAEKALARRHADLRDAVKDRDAVAGDLKESRERVDRLLRDVTLYERQGRHVKALYEAMLQRYVGVKLDTQQFTFPQARQFIDNEVAALEGVLGQIRVQVDDERNQLCAAEPERAAA